MWISVKEWNRIQNWTELQSDFVGGKKDFVMLGQLSASAATAWGTATIKEVAQGSTRWAAPTTALRQGGNLAATGSKAME